MKKFIKLFVLLSIILLCSSCGLFRSKTPTVNVSAAPTAPAAPVVPDVIKYIINFHLQCDNQLNMYQNTPHALLLCVYQLKDLIAFNQLLEDKDGMAKIMECKRFDPSVSYVKRFVLQPGQDFYEVMECADGTKTIAIVAGYYNFDKKQAVKIITIPMSDVAINLSLGSHEIKDLNTSDSKKNDSNTNDSKKNDSKINDSKTSDSNKSDLKTNDSKTSDSKKSDSKTNDSKTNDSKKNDSKKNDSGIRI